MGIRRRLPVFPVHEIVQAMMVSVPAIRHAEGRVRRVAEPAGDWMAPSGGNAIAWIAKLDENCPETLEPETS
jgi:hypothetical protein